MHQIYKHVIPYVIITKHSNSSVTTSTLQQNIQTNKK
jgi:hypothetical protein